MQVRQSITMGSSGTSDYASLFRLLAILRERVKWVQTEYQPKYSAVIEIHVGMGDDGQGAWEARISGYPTPCASLKAFVLLRRLMP